MISPNRTVIFFSALFLLSFFLFLPGFTLYFHQDDFMHMMHARTWQQVIHSFNLFAPGEFPFYRPIPTQVYFFFLDKIFGLQPQGYHLVNFVIYFLNSILVYRLGILLTHRWKVGAIASLIYAINSTHAAPIFSAAYVHELLYVSFGLLMVISYMRYLKKERSLFFALLFFVLALMTKENAVVLPGILVLVTIWHWWIARFSRHPGLSRIGAIVSDSGLAPAVARQNDEGVLGIKFFRKIVMTLAPFTVILAIYLYGHFVYYGLAVSSSYSVIIGKETIKILLWYFLWALSVPNILIDFLQPGLTLSPVFFSVAQGHAYIFLVLFPLLLIFLLLVLWSMVRSIRHHRTVMLMIILSSVWFVTAMIPLLPFPLHHLATEQAFALTGLAIGIGVLIDWSVESGGWKKIAGYCLIGVYLLHAANTIILAQKTHWIVRSSQQAQRVISTLQHDSGVVTAGKTIVFLDGTIKIPEYGSSKQLYEALGNEAAIRIFFGEEIGQLYEFKDEVRREDISKDWIILDSSRFLGY